MLAILVKLNAAPREFHKTEARMASRKLARAIQNQVEAATSGLHLERFLHSDYRNPVFAQNIHDTQVTRHRRTRSVGPCTIFTRARNSHNEVGTTRQERAVLQQRIPEHRRRR